MKVNYPYIIGIDEVGRGPLAGPVFVVGVKISVKLSRSSIFSGIRDSKQLTEKQREKWFLLLTKNPEISWSVSRVSPRVIDRVNIRRATNLAVRRVHERLGGYRCFSALDGGLSLPEAAPHQAFIRGDERIPVIAAASIIAKVLRDSLMTRIDAKFPRYGFRRHKGYGTKEHMKALKKFGPIDIHRKSFLSFLEV